MMEKMTQNPAMGLQTEKYEGNDIVSIPLGPMGDFAVAITDKMLIAAGGESVVKGLIDLLDGDTSSDSGSRLADDAALKSKIDSIAPSQVTMLSASSEEYLASYFQSLASTMEDTMPPDAEPLFAVLSALGSVLGSSVGYGHWTESGFHGESVLFYRK
jgi:hypothetical protein